jgi:hypothetical protein
MGVGIAAGAVCVVLAVWFLWRRRRRNREKVMEDRSRAGAHTVPRTGNGTRNGVDSTTELVGLSHSGMAGDARDRSRTPPPAYAP